MPLIMDVLTHIDERSAAESARQLQRQFEEGGHEAGERFGGNLIQGMTAGFQSSNFDSLTGVLESAGMSAQASRSGEAIGVAFAAGITVAAGAALVDLGVKVGETFEGINRQIELHTAASGKALDDLKSHADALVGSLDSSTQSLGTDMATLATRLHMGPGAALDQLTQHVEMLRDRMGDFNVGALSGALHNMGVSGAEADSALASLVATAQRTDAPLSELVNNLAANSDLFKDLHLTAGQAANMLGEIGAKGVPATTAIMGLQMGMKAAKAEGEDFNTFIRRISDSLDYYAKKGDEASAEQLSLAVGGPRKWADLQTAAHAYLDTVQQGAGAFQGQSQQLDDLQKNTRNLHNQWELVENRIKAALAPVALNVVDDISGKMDGFVGWLGAHQQDLANFFGSAIHVIGEVVKGVGDLAALLGRHPQLIQDVAIAFGTWEAIKGVDAVLTGLEAVGAWLVGAPATAAAAEVGVDAAMTGMAATTTAAGAEMGLAFGPVMGELAAMPAEAEVAGTAIATSMTAADGAVVALGASIDTAIASMSAFAVAAAPFLAVAAGVAALMGAATAFGSATGQEDTPDYTQGGATALGPDGKPLLGPDGKPITAGMGRAAPQKPGTGAFAPSNSPDVGGRAGPTLPGGPVASGPDNTGGGPPSDLLTPTDLDPKKGGKGSGPEVPYAAGYGAAPAPGETAERYEAEQRVLEQRHAVDEAAARLNQLEHDNTATQDDIQKARNDLLKAQGDENTAELRLYQDQTKQLGKHADEMGDLGAKIDKDFGVSKGLSGIADNLTKFLGNLMMAGPLAALNHMVEASGVKQAAPGAGGLLGIGAVTGAFGPQFMPGAASAGAPGGVPAGPFGGYPGIKGAPSGSAAGPAPAGAAGAPGVAGAAPAGANLDAWITAAETAAGVDASWTAGLKTLIGRESGGNPNAINNWDSNAAAGHPSQGLMQTIPGTFAGNHVPGTSGNITDPVANIAAGIRYIQNRYGGIGGVQQANPNMPPKGYATGGLVRYFDTGGSTGGSTDDHSTSAALKGGRAGAGTAELFDNLWPRGLGDPFAGAGSLLGGAGIAYGLVNQADELGKQENAMRPQVNDRALSRPMTSQEKAQFSPSHFSDGGGPKGTDTIPAWLSPGEFVMNAKAAGQYMPYLKQMNAQYLSGGSDDPLNQNVGGGSPDAGTGSGMPGASGAVQGATSSVIGGASPSAGSGGSMAAPMGGAAAGAAAGAASMGIGLAAQIAMQEAQRAIQAAGQYAGIGWSALEQTFLPTGASQLAQNSWLTRIGGALMGAQPQIPNMAGKSQNKAPEGVSGLGSPMTPPQEVSPFGPSRGPEPGPAGAPGPQPPASGPPTPQAPSALGDAAGARGKGADSLYGASPPDSVLSGGGKDADSLYGSPTPDSVLPAPMPNQRAAQSGNSGGGGSAPAVYIEQYHAHDDPDEAGRDIAAHTVATLAPPRGSSQYA